ncbi:MAG: hypothetical protein Q8K79_13915 [Solirubrobacteraceae bacterium]|nr:hypothetical protein [Solirubrobacteraceae bacterium]
MRGPAATRHPPEDGARCARARGGAATAATTTATDRPCRADLANAGGGLGLGIIQLSAIIPGFLAALILAGALVAVVVVPLMALGLLAALLVAPPYGLWRVAARHRQRREQR